MPICSCPLANGCWMVGILIKLLDREGAGFSICRNARGEYRIQICFEARNGEWSSAWFPTPFEAYTEAIDYMNSGIMPR